VNRLNDIVDRGINAAVSRRLGLPDTGLSLMPELAPTFDLETMPELRYGVGWKRWTKGTTIPALAANNAQIRFQVPATTAPAPPVICIIESIVLSALVAMEIVGRLDLTGFTDLVTVITANLKMDTRQPQVDSFTHVSIDKLAAISSTGIDFILGVNTPTPVPGGPWILTSNIASPIASPPSLSIGSLLANTALTFQCTYRERTLNDAEIAI
jgi:hypothetical protein